MNKPGLIDDVKRRDTCLAFTLLLLIIWLFHPINQLIYAAICLMLLGMAVPKTMTLPAKLWFGFSFYMGQVMSKVILTIIYCLFLVPVGLFRRLMGKDSLRIFTWHNKEDSAFVTRNHTYTKDDLQTPY